MAYDGVGGQRPKRRMLCHFQHASYSYLVSPPIQNRKWKSKANDRNYNAALCRICEPIAFTSIFPYIYYMVLSFNITQDERQVAIYAGMVTSAFALAEFSASVFWGRLSDRVGRKPILLTGLAGTGVSMLAFGFSLNLPMALLARAVGGILNGSACPLGSTKPDADSPLSNIAVLNTAVAEVVTIEAHQRMYPLE